MAESRAQQAAQPVALHDLSGTSVGRFAIQARLGVGGMGEVYRAEDTKLKRPVALKRIAPHLRTDEHYRQRFLREAELASQLSYEHIAGVYDVFEEGPDTFLVMEYVEGESLRQRLGHPMPVEEFLPIALQCAMALAAAHDRGILHRDIKPENIMLTPAGRVKILDFGIAKRLPRADETASVETQGGAFGGTPAYMAPEVLLEKEADARSDIFSLGVVFYEALAGKHPFRADSFVATSNRILEETPAPLHSLNPDVPAQLDQVITKMLAKDAAARYASAADLLTDLRAIQRSFLPSPASPVSASAPGQRWLREFAGPAAVALVLAALAASSVGYWAWRNWHNTGPPAGAADAQMVHSIAVLPFRNVGHPGDYDYFGVGLADVLNAKLTNARFLEVHAPRADASFADPRLDFVEIGKRLNVDAVLTGSYQIEGATLSLSYTLVDTRRNVEIAGDALTKPFTQSIEVEHRLASEIVDALKVSASPEERAHFMSAPTEQGEAFQAYLRSNYEMEQFWKRPSADEVSRAEEALNEALRLDPQFTLALVSLAKLHWFAVFWGYAKGPATLFQAEQEASRAIQQDPGLGEAYAARALVEFEQGKLAQARESLRVALAHSPNSALGYYGAGYYYLGRGLSDLSLRAFHRAQELDPNLVRGELAFAYRYQGDLVQAEEQARRDLAAHQDDFGGAEVLVRVLIARGNLSEARQIEQNLLRRAPDDPTVQEVAALLEVSGGNPFSIKKWLSRYGNVYWAEGGYCANVAAVLALARQNQEALRWLRRAGELSMRNYPFLSLNPFYDNLRMDPEFQAYLESVRPEWEAVKRDEEQHPLLPQGTP